MNPAALIGGRLLGSLIALALVRRQPTTKLLFNLSNFLLGTCVAVLVYRAVIGTAEPFDPRGWVAAFAATSTSLLASAIAVSLVIAASDGKLRSPLDSIKGMGALTTVLSTYLGVLAVSGLAPVRTSPWLFAAAAAMIFAAYRVHGRVRQSATHLEQLYDFNRTITSSLTQGA